MNDKTKQLAETQETNIVPLNQAAQVMDSLTKSLESGQLTPDSLEKVLDMQERILDRNAKQDYTIAMVAVQKEMKVIGQDADNNQTKSSYSTLEAINKSLVPIYTENGFSLSFGTADSPLELHVRITCDVMHSSGHSKEYHCDMPLDMTGIKGTQNKTKIHGTGSAMKYGRRYLTSMIFNVSTGDADDDGNDATFRESITEEQSNQIDAKITENDLPRDRLMDWIKEQVHVEAIEEIPADWFDSVMKRIDSAIRAKK